MMIYLLIYFTKENIPEPKSTMRSILRLYFLSTLNSLGPKYKAIGIVAEAVAGNWIFIFATALPTILLVSAGTVRLISPPLKLFFAINVELKNCCLIEIQLTGFSKVLVAPVVAVLKS